MYFCIQQHCFGVDIFPVEWYHTMVNRKAQTERFGGIASLEKWRLVQAMMQADGMSLPSRREENAVLSPSCEGADFSEAERRVFEAVLCVLRENSNESASEKASRMIRTLS